MKKVRDPTLIEGKGSYTDRGSKVRDPTLIEAMKQGKGSYTDRGDEAR